MLKYKIYTGHLLPHFTAQIDIIPRRAEIARNASEELQVNNENTSMFFIIILWGSNMQCRYLVCLHKRVNI
jgi:hypothetical protein